MTRRPAAFTQAEAARFIKAAKQAGCGVKFAAGELLTVPLDRAEEPIEAPPTQPEPQKEEFDPI